MASLLEVGTGFHPEMTGRENIYMNGAIMGMSRAEITRKLDEIIDFSGVARYIDTPVKRYSSGMLVRLGFAVAAHLESEILIVDEVLAVGDAEFQEKALGKMRDVTTADGRTVLFVSHNMGAVKALCTRGIVLEQGMLVCDGKTDEAISIYKKGLKKETNDKQTIREAGVRVSPDIEIYSFRINGRETLCPVLDDFENVLKIEVSGRIEKRTRLEIEGRIFDENEVPMAMFSPGHNRRKYKVYESGLFFLQETIFLSSGIHKGNYNLCLDITSPGVEYFFRVPPLIRLEIPGFISVKGNVFEYRNGNGFIQLFDEQYLLETDKLSRLQ
jgi:lipopolysaccharide transport system ATP-binding protein